MDIAFRVRNVEVPATLRQVTHDRVARLVRGCGLDRAEVCFSARRNPRIAEREVCEITLFGRGRVLQAEAAATDAAVAADRVVGQLEQRLERFRGRVSGRSRPRRSARTTQSTPGRDGSVHFRSNWATGRDQCGAPQGVGIADQTADRGLNDSTTEPLTPEEAALAMGEQGSDIFSFVNAETGGSAVVYRRRDGEIALWELSRTGAVDPRAWV